MRAASAAASSGGRLRASATRLAIDVMSIVAGRSGHAVEQRLASSSALARRHALGQVERGFHVARLHGCA